MHVVSLTCSCQSGFCNTSNELSVDKIFKYSQSPHISAAHCRSPQLYKISPPSLPPSSVTRLRVGWSDSVPVAFAHVHEYCRHFVILCCSLCAGKFEKRTYIHEKFNLFETRMSVRMQTFYFYREKSWRGNWKLSFALHWLPSASIHASSSFHHACLR